jgi:plastocyanin
LSTKRILIFTLIFLMMITLPAWAQDGTDTGKSGAFLSGSIKAQGLRKLDDILVYLTGPGVQAKQTLPPEDAFILDQNNLTFLPHILVIPKGSTVAFPNNDKVDHNVFSLSRTKNFNFGSYKPGESQNVAFDKPGIVELRCDLHSEMISYILVMKNSYFAKTDKKGNFTLDISGLAPGEYKLKTWHEKLKNSKLKIKLPETAATPLALKLKRGAPGVLFK